MNEDVVLAHKHCTKHRAEIQSSSLCGCFYCFSIFPPSEIVDGSTTVKPLCVRSALLMR